MREARVDSLLRTITETFEPCVNKVLEELPESERADIAVGIPFYNEADTIGLVIETAVQGLEQHFPEKKGSR